MVDEEIESMEECEKLLEDAKFIMKNDRYMNHDNNTNSKNQFGTNSINLNNINVGSSVATAAFNNMSINPLNNISNTNEDNKNIFYSINEGDDTNIINEQKSNNEGRISSPKNNYNNIKGSVISMKDNFLNKSSSIVRYDSNNINNNNNDIINENQEEIKELREEISKIKFLIEINHQKYINYEKTIEKLRILHRENELKYQKLYSDLNKKNQNLKEKYKQKETEIYNENLYQEKEYEKTMNKLNIQYNNLKENNNNLKQKLFLIKKKSDELEQINIMKENALREELNNKNNEINNLQENINYLKDSYLLIEGENEKKIKELSQQINEQNSIYNNSVLKLKKLENQRAKNQKLYSIKKNSSSISIFKDENHREQYRNKFRRNINSYNDDLCKEVELKEKIKKLENEIIKLDFEINEKNDENDSLTEAIKSLRNELKNSELNNKNNIKIKCDDKTINELQLIANEYENNLSDIKQTYDFKIKEQDNEIKKITLSYQQKIKDLIEQINNLNYKVLG